MFAAVLISPAEKTGLRGLLDRCLGTPVNILKVHADFFDFQVMEVREDRWGNVDWREIMKSAKREGIEALLIQDNLRLPEFIRPMVCSSGEYRGIYCYRIAHMIARAVRHHTGLKAGLIDLYGAEDCRAAMKIFSFASSVTVVTKNASNYGGLKKWAGSQRGSPLFLSGDIDSLRDCQVILAPFGADGIFSGKPMKGVLISSKFVPVSWNGAVVDGFLPEIPPDIDAFRPEVISPLEFASALWKYCGLSPLSRLPVAALSCRGRPVELKEICTMLDSFPWV